MTQTATSFSGIMGLNANVTIGEEVFHVQTEDLGLKKATVVTHVFGSHGNVVRVVKYDYARHIENPKLPEILPAAMRMQHDTVISKLRSEGGLTPPPETKTPPPVLYAVAPEPEETQCLHEKVSPSGWDRIIDKLAPAVPKPHVPWDLIVKTCRDAGEPEPESFPEDLNDEEAPPSLPAVPASPTDEEDALAAYRAAREYLRADLKVPALSFLAKAVHLQPANLRYRLSLLDLLSKLEHSVYLVR